MSNDVDMAPNKSNKKLLMVFFTNDKKVLRIGFNSVSYDFQAREILANSIAKFLSAKSTNNTFKKKPVVFFVD